MTSLKLKTPAAPCDVALLTTLTRLRELNADFSWHGTFDLSPLVGLTWLFALVTDTARLPTSLVRCNLVTSSDLTCRR